MKSPLILCYYTTLLLLLLLSTSTTSHDLDDDAPGFNIFSERLIHEGMKHPLKELDEEDNADANLRRMTHDDAATTHTIHTTHTTHTTHSSSSTTDTRSTAYKPTDHQPLRVLFETSTMIKQAREKGADFEVIAEHVDKYILSKIRQKLFDSLSTIRDAGYFIPSDVCFDAFDIPDEWTQDGLVGYDLVVMVSNHDYLESGGVRQELCFDDDAGFKVLASATACAFNKRDRPIIGFINICLNEIELTNGVVSDATSKDTYDVFLHEITHVVGLISSMYPYYRDSNSGNPLTPRPLNPTSARCVTDGELQFGVYLPCENTMKFKEESVPTLFGDVTRGYFELTLPTVKQVIQNQFNCDTLEGARLENQPTSDDCSGSHFDERFFFTELSSAIYDEDADYFSPLTLALLEDTGFYKANFEMTDNSPFGLGAGCEFYNEKCIVDNKVPEYGKGYFCDNVNEKPWQCGPAHLYKGKCDLDPMAFPDINYFSGMMARHWSKKLYSCRLLSHGCKK